MHRLRKAGVVGVRVGEDHRVDVTQTEAERCNVGGKAVLETREPRVHCRQAAVVLDQVPVEERVAEPVDP